MADPRAYGPQQRSANLSELMKALIRRSAGEVVNFCPFGCRDDELDDNGACGHLIGFYNKGSTYEPRLRRKKGNRPHEDGRIITDGSRRRPMEKGFRLVRITSTARVYSPTPNKDLIVTRDEYDKVQAEIVARESQLLAAAEQIRNPTLDGEWGKTGYDEPVDPKAATAAA